MKRKVLAAQNVSRMCMVCGVRNPSALGARFFELENGELLGVFTPREEHQGYPQRLHGGIAASLLDETIGRAVSVGLPDVWGVTVELNVRYRRPVPLDEDVRALARITSDSGRVFEGTGEIVLADGTVAVEASGKYVKMDLDRIADADVRDELIRDERPLPESFDI